MRRHNAGWTLALIVTDIVFINVAFALAWYVRYELAWTLPFSESFSEGFYPQPYSAYIPHAIVMTLIAIAIYRIEGLYFPVRGRSLLDEVYVLLNGTTTATLLMMALTFAVRPLVYSRAVYLYAGVLTVLLLGCARAAERVVQARLRQRGIGVNRVLIVGAGEVGRALMRNIVAQPDLGYQIVGFVDDHHERGHTDIGRFKALGETDKLPCVLRDLSVDEVIITLPWKAREKIIAIMELCQRMGISSEVVPDLFQLTLSRVTIDDVGGVPLIGVREPRIGTWNTVLKRTIDLVGSLVLLMLLMPFFVLVAIVIKLDSPGPIIFRQKRIGREGRPFITYKFRTMREGAEEEQPQLLEFNEADGPLFKIRNDPRHTRLGRWLRRMSIDELPQLLNVVRGEMSLVGPRPPVVSEVEHYQEWHRERFQVCPGMTGLWQVSGRSELPFDEMCMLDIYYIENWSPWLDFWIMLRTIPTVLLARGAY
jgi:exopolysaccharide biosynthesis polyprenyl glycosylphosphotransferase